MKNNGNITTVLSLFDGISCARVALDRLGYTDVLYLASEVDKYASAITRHQWPDTIHLGDITQIKRENLPVQIDLLIGGSPCQDLSIAKNNRKGLEGERSGLFWEWVRLWKECNPRYWVLENVNSMPKGAKRIISETLGVEPIMINAALVSAQNRKRLFWTNIQTDMFGNCHIPQPADRGILLKHILESDCGLEAVGIIQTGHGYNSGGIKAADGKTPPLTISAWEHNNKLIIPEATKKGYAIAEEGDGVDLSYPNSKTKRGRVSKKAPSQMTSSQSVGVLEGYTIRKPTPVECERLMTLPDQYTALGDFGDGEAKPISNTQRYKTLGNGFVVEVVAHILSYMEES
jgi:DNA-cytosine methyltransferase